MKRDFDLVRKILLAAEKQDANGNPPIAPKGYSNTEIRYHIKIMVDGGLVAERQNPLTELPAPVFDGMTWEGHEFLDSIRDKEHWTKVKTMLKEKGVDMSFEAIKAAVIYYIKDKFGG